MSFTHIRSKHVKRIGVYYLLLVAYTAGLWSVPAKALSVPLKETRRGSMMVAYNPVPDYLLYLILAPILYIGYVVYLRRMTVRSYANNGENLE